MNTLPTPFGITFEGTLRIGDILIFSSFPENYFNHFGEKVVDVDNHWCFDHNPYVLRDVKPESAMNLYNYANSSQRLPWGKGRGVVMSYAEAKYHRLGIPVTLRHPRLYKFEDQVPDPKKIIVHTTGRGADAGGMNFYESDLHVMPDYVINHIDKTYSKTHEIIQIGSKSDKDTPFTDKRGLPIWESIEEIASAGQFIGVNSGPLNIAFCYPRIHKKVVLAEYQHEEYLRHDWFPCDANIPHNQFWDWSMSIYNVFDCDAGVTHSYLKL